MTREQIEAMFARREQCWRNRDVDGLVGDYAPTGVVISPTGGVLEGLDEIARIYRVWFTAFPDLTMDITGLLIDGDQVVMLANIAGTHAGDFFGLPATGRRVQAVGAFVYKLEDEHIVHERRILDFTGVLVQVGVLKAKPAPGL